MYEPQGPLPREVYVRRRVAAAVVALIVVAAVVLALYLASRGEGTDTKDAATTGQEQQPDATGAASTSAPASTGPQSASRGRCDDKDLALTVWPADANVRIGTPVRFYTQVTNTSKTACDRDLAGAPLAFEVYRLEDNGKVWSSVDCSAPTKEDKVVLQPGVAVSRQVEWTGRISSPGACADGARTPAGVGPYQVYALVGKVFSPAATFNLVKD